LGLPVELRADTPCRPQEAGQGVSIRPKFAPLRPSRGVFEPLACHEAPRRLWCRLRRFWRSRASCQADPGGACGLVVARKSRRGLGCQRFSRKSSWVRRGLADGQFRRSRGRNRGFWGSRGVFGL